LINYYKLLEIANFSDIAAVKTAYRKKAKQFHPDISARSSNNASENEEIFKWINLANATLSNPTAKKAYDQKLQFALTTGTYQQTTNRKTKPSKEDLFAFAEKEKQQEIQNYNNKDQNFSYKNRIIIASVLAFWGLYFCYENWFFTIDQLGIVTIIIGFLLFFISTLYLTQLVYRKLRVTSFHKNGYFKFYENISVYGFTLIMILGPMFVITFSDLKKSYHLKNYGKEVIARILFNEGPGLAYEFITAQNIIIRKNQPHPDNPKISEDYQWVLIKYSTKDPRISEIVSVD
jgi:hypothetical protein